METVKIYFCDWYRSFDVNNNYFINVLKKYYNVKIDCDEPDFLFYSCFGYSHTKYKNCTKVFYTGEAIIPNFNECDYAIGFSPLNFGERYFQRKPYVKFSPDEIDCGLLDRNFCNFIYSQDCTGEGALFRRLFCKKLMEYKWVDAPGKILNNMREAITPRHGGNWVGGKLDFIKKYKFTLAIENAEMEGYITEKLVQPLRMHSVPIYWGAPDVGKYLNTKSFIHLREFERMEDAIEYIRYLDNNDDEYMKILKTNPCLHEVNPNESLKKFIYSIIEKGNKPFSKSPLLCHEPQKNVLYDVTAKLAELYCDYGFEGQAKECAELCASLDTRRRVDIYPLLEDVYSGNKNDFMKLLKRQKQNIIRYTRVRPEYLKELCKIAMCYMHIGEFSLAEELVEYVLEKDPDSIDAKKVSSEKGKRGGRKNKIPNREYVIKNWENFLEDNCAASEQRSAVFSFCLKHGVKFVYDQELKKSYKHLLRLWRPFHLERTSLIRIGAKNYGGHIMADPGSNGIAVGVGDHYSQWNFQMAERGFTVHQFAENISNPPREHANLRVSKILFSKEKANDVLNEIFSSIGDGSKDLVMQMDIRGKEWAVLGAMTESQLQRFSQMAIDFHGLKEESRLEAYANVFRKLNKTHRIVHLQYNNNVTILCFKDFLISDVMRITYVRRDVGDFSVSEESFPLSMDYPTIPNLPEVFIGKFSDILDNESNLSTSEEQCNLPTNDSWRTFYQDTVLYTDWLKKKNIYQGNSTLVTAGYNYLYVLCRLLNDYRPGNILEFNFDQATKMTAQYATSHETSLTVLANNRERVLHLMKCWDIQWNNVVIHGTELLKTMENGNQGVVYQNFTRITKGKKYNLILLKSPLQNDISIHLDILSCMTDILEDDFAILMDHVENECGRRVYQEMIDILNNTGVNFLKKDFPAQNHAVGLLASESWKYIAEF